MCVVWGCYHRFPVGLETTKAAQPRRRVITMVRSLATLKSSLCKRLLSVSFLTYQVSIMHGRIAYSQLLVTVRKPEEARITTSSSPLTHQVLPATIIFVCQSRMLVEDWPQSASSWCSAWIWLMIVILFARRAAIHNGSNRVGGERVRIVS